MCILFALSATIYISGILYKGTNKNLLTVVAVLGLLPACRYAVSVILYLKTKGCSLALHDSLEKVDSKLPKLYDMYFTSYQKNFQVSHIVCKNNCVIGITEDEKTDITACEKHLQTMINQEGHHVTVKIFKDKEKYMERLHTLQEAALTTENSDQILDFCCHISL
ncbi:MAG: hypothetical protein PHP50_01440 [Lachnospiraceae bacterium]|nr:hypothetical protein [Lachnospiraceae bacterium]